MFLKNKLTMEKKSIFIQKENVVKLFNLLNSEDTLKTPGITKHFIEFVIRNKKVLDVEKEIIMTQFLETTNEENNYLQKEYEILTKYCKRNENNELSYPLFVPKDNIANYNDAIAKLNEEMPGIYEKLIEKNVKQKEELLEQIELELYTIEFDLVPDSVNSELYTLLREVELININE